MLNTISTIDLIASLCALMALMLLSKGWKRGLAGVINFALAGLILLTFFHDFTNLLQWSGITDVAEIEYYVEILVPVFWFLFFYSFFRELATQELKESEEKYRSLIENIPDVTWRSDIEGNTIFISSNVGKTYGYTPEEIYESDSRLWFGQIHPDDIERVKEAHARLFKENKKYNIKYRIKKKDGKWIWLQIEVNKALLDAWAAKPGLTKENIIGSSFLEIAPEFKGTDRHKKYLEVLKTGNSFSTEEVVSPSRFGSTRLFVKVFKVGDGLGIIAEDITESKKAEEDLKESEERYRTLMEGASDAIFIADTETGMLVDANKRAEELIGRSLEEICKMRHFELHPPEEKERYREIFEEHSLKGGGFSQDLEVVNGKGRRIPVSINAGIVEVRGKRYIQGIFRDITERKKAEEALRMSEAKYQDLYDNAPDMFVSVDAKTARILNCNQTLARATGYTKDELIGKPVFDMYHPDCVDEVKKAFNEFVVTGELKNREFQIIKKDGTKIDVSLNVSSVRGENGDILYSRSVWRDISERKKIDHMKDNLVRDTSHALKNPIAMTEMALDMLERNMDRGDMESVKTTEEMIHRNLEGLRDSVDKVLRVSSMEGGTITEKRPLSLKTMVDRVEQDFEHKMKKKGLEFRKDIAEGADLIVADESDMINLLNNLIDNALKFTEKGTISLRARAEKGMAEISVEDTGSGINKEDIGKVFDKFFRKRPDLTGTGLGLTICRDAVLRHNGTIDVFSEGEGKGTKVTVKIPLKGGRNERAK